MRKREGIFLEASSLHFHFWLLLIPSHFYPFISNAFSWHLLFLKQKKRKENKENKPIKKKKNVEMGGSFPSNSHCALSLLAPVFCPLAFALLF
jgi:hypothetical protein